MAHRGDGDGSRDMIPKPIIIVQGGQWGSEAKGLVTQKLTNAKKVDVAIRTGTVNAGHTIWYKGKQYKMQQLPVSWVRPECQLVLGPGAYIHPEILSREIAWINEAMPGSDVRDRIWIDHRCGYHGEIHTAKATESGRHHRMGATGKGSSEAVIAKIRGRGDDRPYLYRDYADDCGAYHKWHDTVSMVNGWFDEGKQLLIEGTQGTMLDLHIGPYPYTTHKQTQVGSWMAEAGLSPALPTDIWLVMRTFPIRVAGNSGPMPDEVSWVDLACDLNADLQEAGRGPLIDATILDVWEEAVYATIRERYPEAPMKDPAWWTQAEREAHREAASDIHALAWKRCDRTIHRELSRLFERTTVTDKLRRIARWDWGLAEESVMLNRPHHIALTFMNYLYPADWATTTLPVSPSFTERVEGKLDVAVDMVSYGPLEENTFICG